MASTGKKPSGRSTPESSVGRKRNGKRTKKTGKKNALMGLGLRGHSPHLSSKKIDRDVIGNGTKSRRKTEEDGVRFNGNGTLISAHSLTEFSKVAASVATPRKTPREFFHQDVQSGSRVRSARRRVLEVDSNTDSDDSQDDAEMMNELESTIIMAAEKARSARSGRLIHAKELRRQEPAADTNQSPAAADLTSAGRVVFGGKRDVSKSMAGQEAELASWGLALSAATTDAEATDASTSTLPPQRQSRSPVISRKASSVKSPSPALKPQPTPGSATPPIPSKTRKTTPDSRVSVQWKSSNTVQGQSKTVETVPAKTGHRSRKKSAAVTRTRSAGLMGMTASAVAKAKAAKDIRQRMDRKKHRDLVESRMRGGTWNGNTKSGAAAAAAARPTTAPSALSSRSSRSKSARGSVEAPVSRTKSSTRQKQQRLKSPGVSLKGKTHKASPGISISVIKGASKRPRKASTINISKLYGSIGSNERSLSETREAGKKAPSRSSGLQKDAQRLAKLSPTDTTVKQWIAEKKGEDSKESPQKKSTQKTKSKNKTTPSKTAATNAAAATPNSTATATATATSASPQKTRGRAATITDKKKVAIRRTRSATLGSNFFKNAKSSSSSKSSSSVSSGSGAAAVGVGSSKTLTNGSVGRGSSSNLRAIRAIQAIRQKQSKQREEEQSNGKDKEKEKERDERAKLDKKDGSKLAQMATKRASVGSAGSSGSSPNKARFGSSPSDHATKPHKKRIGTPRASSSAKAKPIRFSSLPVAASVSASEAATAAAQVAKAAAEREERAQRVQESALRKERELRSLKEDDDRLNELQLRLQAKRKEKEVRREEESRLAAMAREHKLSELKGIDDDDDGDEDSGAATPIRGAADSYDDDEADVEDVDEKTARGAASPEDDDVTEYTDDGYVQHHNETAYQEHYDNVSVRTMSTDRSSIRLPTDAEASDTESRPRPFYHRRKRSRRFKRVTGAVKPYAWRPDGIHRTFGTPRHSDEPLRVSVAADGDSKHIASSLAGQDVNKKIKKRHSTPVRDINLLKAQAQAQGVDDDDDDESDSSDLEDEDEW